MYLDTKYLRLPMISSSVVGIFPWQFTFQEDPKNQRNYALYSRFMLGVYMVITLLYYSQFFMLLRENPLRPDEIGRCICISLISTMTVVRQFVMRLHPGYKKLLTYIIDTERYIFAGKDQKVLSIYNKCTKTMTTNLAKYLTLVGILVFLHALRPFFTEEFKMIGNETVEIRSFPVPSYVPFDENAHFVNAYIFTFISLMIGAYFVINTDVLMFPLLMYPIGQLEILHHILQNFDKYSEKIKGQFQTENEETVACAAFYYCIRKHKEVIQYMDNFNRSMSLFMIYDFVQSSLQFASVVIQLLVVQTSVWDWIFVSSFVIFSVNRLHMYYYYANEVLLLSDSLSSSIWQSNWYEQSKKVKNMMMIFMLRTTNPLKFNIGPFGYMSLDTFIAILKASYSYIMLMYETKKT
ncbi:odorant receptor 43a-like [Anthonomus grandis grandis]|uniref:odorant receptor 43a-like n=1 Tax=Anthonomus grandis grandis TaxID=2921223 RepID=UPI002165056C|nr:odorant receptor 43a-like [Anthonomus grandis grandis]